MGCSIEELKQQIRDQLYRMQMLNETMSDCHDRSYRASQAWEEENGALKEMERTLEMME